MNVLKPELTWVDGRCYRLSANTEWSNARNLSPYVEDNCHLDYNDYEDEHCDSNIEIVPYGGSRFKHTFHVAKTFFPFIIGSKNAVRKRLETETRTTIQVPKVGQDGDIVIVGSDPKGIITARHRIDLLMEATRKKIPITHFISIPFNEGHIIMKFNMFKSDVLTHFEKTSRGVDKMLFQTPSKLHLTIVGLTLLDDAERNQAIKALNYCEDHIVKPMMEKHQQIRIRLQGTDIMNDDPSETNVLYAKIIDPDNVLQEMANKILNHFSNIGLIVPRNDTVKLHITLMNTKFLLDDEQREQKPKRSLNTFDATEIMKAHKDTFLGETVLKEIHLSQRHTISSNGYYQATAKITLH